MRTHAQNTLPAVFWASGGLTRPFDWVFTEFSTSFTEFSTSFTEFSTSFTEL